MKIKRLPHEERPREKMMYHGKEALSNAELLSILLRTGTREKSALDMAQEILALDSSGLLYLQTCTPEELYRVKGMGAAKACQLLAAAELGKRMAGHPKKDRVQIKNPEDIVQLFLHKMKYYQKEHFHTLLLNAKGYVLEDVEVSIGDLSSTLIHPREVFHQAVRRSAAAVVLVHNHPSGDPAPSPEDVETTERLVRSAEILGINVLDHIIIGGGGYISLKSKGLM